MKITKTKGFSLAEVLISLTIVSVVLAVAVPTITKKNSVGDDSWHWTTGEYQNGASINKQKLLLGNNFIPKANFADPSKTDLIENNYFPSMYQKSSKDYEHIAIQNNAISKDAKLNIVKNRIDDGAKRDNAIQNMRDSHIAFYNVGGVGNQAQYAGRLASEQFNLALGIGALQSIDERVLSLNKKEQDGNGRYQYKKDVGSNKIDHLNWNMAGSENTAIGHYALANLIGTKRTDVQNSGGTHNVALGYKAMYDVTYGNENTAVGYNALAKTITKTNAESLISAAPDDDKGKVGITKNTVVGNFLGQLNDTYTHAGSSTDMITGRNNVLVGNYSELSKTDKRREFGMGNTFIGHNAGRGLPLNTAVTFNTGTLDKPKFDNILAIGNVVPDATDETGVELIQTTFKSVDIGGKSVEMPRKIVINGDFTIRSLDGTRTIFKVDATDQAIGYSQDHASFTWKNASDTTGTNGPARCEGADFCVGKFNIPVPNTSVFFVNHAEYEDVYDIYVKNMAVSTDEGASIFGKLNKLPHLKTALMYLDRYKDTNGTIINFFDKFNVLQLFGINSDSMDVFKKYFGSDFSIKDLVNAFLGMSDERVKNIYGDATIGLKEIDALKVKNYTYKADKNKIPHVGVIAQELKEIFPNSVIEGSDGYLSIKQEEMFYGLVKSIQELSAKNNQIKDKLALTYEQIKYTNEQNKLIEQENKLLEKQNKEFAKRIAKLQKNK